MLAFHSGRRCWSRQFARSLSMSTASSTHSRFASSSVVPGGATLIERMRALFASTGLKSLTCPNASIWPDRRDGMSEHTRALLAEIAGTFMFFVIGAGAIVTTVASGSPPNSLLAIALAHGLALAIAVSAFGAISGGHFNPAVT